MINPKQTQPDLSVNSAAAEMAVTPRKIWDLIHYGKLASYQVGKARRIARADLDDFKARNAMIGLGAE